MPLLSVTQKMLTKLHLIYNIHTEFKNVGLNIHLNTKNENALRPKHVLI